MCGGMNLVDIATQIKAEHEAVAASFKRGLEHAMRAGDLLIEVKKQLRHGEWLPWLEKNCGGVTPRSAQHYMKLSKHRVRARSKYETDFAFHGSRCSEGIGCTHARHIVS